MHYPDRGAITAIMMLGLVAGCKDTPQHAAPGTQNEDAVPRNLPLDQAGGSSVDWDRVAPSAPVPAVLATYVAERFPDIEVTIRHARFDLNGDGREEVIGYLSGRSMCGSGGCNLVVLESHGDKAIVRGYLTVSRPPIGVFASRTNGWRDLAVTIGGGGIRGDAAGPVRVPYGGERYAGNPSIAPAQRSREPFELLLDQEPLRPEQLDRRSEP